MCFKEQQNKYSFKVELFLSQSESNDGHKRSALMYLQNCDHKVVVSNDLATNRMLA